MRPISLSQTLLRITLSLAILQSQVVWANNDPLVCRILSENPAAVTAKSPIPNSKLSPEGERLWGLRISQPAEFDFVDLTGRVAEAKLRAAQARLMTSLVESVGRKPTYDKGEAVLSVSLSDGSKILGTYKSDNQLVTSPDGKQQYIEVFNLGKLVLRTRGGGEIEISKDPLTESAAEFREPTVLFSSPTIDGPTQKTRVISRGDAFNKLLLNAGLDPGANAQRPTRSLLDWLLSFLPEASGPERATLEALPQSISDVGLPKQIADPRLLKTIRDWQDFAENMDVKAIAPNLDSGWARTKLKIRGQLESEVHIFGKTIGKITRKVLILSLLVLTAGTGFLKIYMGQFHFVKAMLGIDDDEDLKKLPSGLIQIFGQMNSKWKDLLARSPGNPVPVFEGNLVQFWAHVSALGEGKSDYQLFVGSRDNQVVSSPQIHPTPTALRADQFDPSTVIAHLPQTESLVVAYIPPVEDLTKAKATYLVLSRRSQPKLYGEITSRLNGNQWLATGSKLQK